VKKSTLILTVVAGALVFLVVLVLHLPASWFAGKLPPQVQCQRLGGSVWRGECLGLAVAGGRFGNATWNLSALSALTGKLSGDVDVRGGAVTMRSSLNLGLDGSGELTGLQAQFPLDPVVSPQFPRDQRGLVIARFARLVLGPNAAPSTLEGSIELHDYRQVSPRPIELGSYRLTFDGQAQAGGGSVGKLNDIGGPFAVEGTVTFTPPNSYLIHGHISGRTPEAQRIVREDIALGAPPDASGRNEFSLENSF
jgi:hypothetical protein